MPSNLAIAIAQNKETFLDFRRFLLEKGFTKEQLIGVENGNEDIYIPRCIRYIEYNNITFNEAVNYYVYERPDLDYWDLVKITIIGVFRKIENNDINFVTY